ncbi:M48 family metallopeptidase, partial [Thermoproteota archaeon]
MGVLVILYPRAVIKNDMPDAKPLDRTSPEAKEYHKTKNFLFVAHLLITLGLLLFLTVWGLTIFLRAYLKIFFENALVLNGVFFCVFYFFLNVIGLPLEFYEGLILERKFKLSKQNFFGWFKDYLKKSIISFIITGVMVLAVYKLIGAFYNSWWVFAALLWLMVTLFFTKIFPHIILPLFFKSYPLNDEDLKKRLSRLADKFKFPLSDILVLELSKKTVKANAMVTGLGGSKRIYLSDTLLNDFSHEEIEVVVAHELIHYRNRDMHKHVLVSFLVGIFSFYLCDLFLVRGIQYFGYLAKDDIATLPFFALLLFIASLVVLPFQNGFSRFLERNADRGSIEATGNAKAFISMISRLGEKNLSEFSPSKAIEIFLYDHPPISKRIDLA